MAIIGGLRRVVELKKGGHMSKTRFKVSLSEDWWAEIVAFVQILLAVVGMLGKNGLMISF